MAYRCKLVAKQNLLNKIKKGDVITFVTNTNAGNPDSIQMRQAIANYVGQPDPRQVMTISQYYQYEISYEFIR